MAILPPLQRTLPLVAFMANLIDLNQYNTVLVLHDQTTRSEINMLIESVPSRSDVAGMLVNVFDKPSEYWNITVNRYQDQLILTMLQTKNIFATLRPLYNSKRLNIRCKNLVVCENFKLENSLRYILVGSEINAVFVDWSVGEAMIYARNPYSANQLIELNETEFLRASKFVTEGKYMGLFFENL